MSAKWIEKLYFGFLLLLPLVYCTTIVDPVLLPRQILLTVFLFLVAVLLILRKAELEFNFKTPLFYAIGGFILLNIVSFYRSDIAGESHAVLSKLMALLTFFLVTTALLYNTIIRVNQLVLAVIFFGLITLSFPVFEIVKKTLEGEHILRRIEFIKGYSANKNLLSSILFLCLPFYFIGLQRKNVKLLSAIAILSTISVLVIIRTRAVLIACLIFFLLLICYKIKRRFSIRKRYFLGFGIAFLLLTLSSYFFYFKSKAANLQASPSNTIRYIGRLLDNETIQSRILFWKNSMLMWHDHLVFGVGLGSWQVQFPKYGLSEFKNFAIINGESTLQRPHNDFLWILCETGLLGLLAYIAIFGVIFYQLYLLITKAATSQEKWKFLYILSALAGYLVISFFDFPYERIEHQVLLMLLFAFTASAYFKIVPKKDTRYRSLLLLLFIPICFSLLVSLYRFNGEQHTAKMYQARISKNWSETIYEAKKANNYFYPLDNSSIPLTWYEGIGHFNENQVEDSEACFEKAYQLTPYNIQVITNLASTYQLTGKTDEAIALYHDALKISKDFDEAKLNLAALYFNKKDFDKAYSFINDVPVTSKNPKYELYLAAILNKKINAYLKTATNKAVIDKLVKNVTTKEALLKLFFDTKKGKVSFEAYLAQVQF
jgi:O-antigen ligase